MSEWLTNCARVSIRHKKNPAFLASLIFHLAIEVSKEDWESPSLKQQQSREPVCLHLPLLPDRSFDTPKGSLLVTGKKTGLLSRTVLNSTLLIADIISRLLLQHHNKYRHSTELYLLQSFHSLLCWENFDTSSVTEPRISPEAGGVFIPGIIFLNHGWFLPWRTML